MSFDLHTSAAMISNNLLKVIRLTSFNTLKRSLLVQYRPFVERWCNVARFSSANLCIVIFPLQLVRFAVTTPTALNTANVSKYFRNFLFVCSFLFMPAFPYTYFFILLFYIHPPAFRCLSDKMYKKLFYDLNL